MTCSNMSSISISVQPNKGHRSRQDTFFNQKLLIFFLCLHENICCGYSLEAPHRGASNEYPQHMFSWKNKKNIFLIPLLSGVMKGGSIYLITFIKTWVSISVNLLSTLPYGYIAQTKDFGKLTRHLFLF